MKDQQYSYEILDSINYQNITTQQLESIASLISPIITINFHILPDNPKPEDEPLTIFKLFEQKFNDLKIEQFLITHFLKHADIKDLFIINYENTKFTAKILLYYTIHLPNFFFDKLYKYIIYSIENVSFSRITISYYYEQIKKFTEKIYGNDEKNKNVIDKIIIIDNIINTWKYFIVYYPLSIFGNYIEKNFYTSNTDKIFKISYIENIINMKKIKIEYRNYLYENIINNIELVKTKYLEIEYIEALIKLYLRYTDLNFNDENFIQRKINKISKKTEFENKINDDLLIPIATMFRKNDTMLFFFINNKSNIVCNYIKKYKETEQKDVIEYILKFLRNLLADSTIILYKDNIKFLIEELEKPLDKASRKIESQLIEEEEKREEKERIERIERERIREEKERIERERIERETREKKEKKEEKKEEEKEEKKEEEKEEKKDKEEEEEEEKDVLFSELEIINETESFHSKSPNETLKKIIFCNLEIVLNKIKLYFFKEDNNYFDILDEEYYNSKRRGEFMPRLIEEIVVFNCIKTYIVHVFSIITSEERINRLQDMGIPGVGYLIIHGGSSIQYYSNKKIKTHDLDYIFKPKTEKSEKKNNIEFIKKCILPYLCNDIINVETIIKTEITDKSLNSLDKLCNSKIFKNQLTSKNFDFDYEIDEERSIIKLYLTTERSRYKIHLLDIKISDDNIEYESIDIETVKINVVKKTYLENKIRNYIDDCEELKKVYKLKFEKELDLNTNLLKDEKCLLMKDIIFKHTSASKTYDIFDSVIYLGCKKSVKQLDAITKPSPLNNDVLEGIKRDHKLTDTDLNELKKQYKTLFKYDLILDDKSIKGDSGKQKSRKRTVSEKKRIPKTLRKISRKRKTSRKMSRKRKTSRKISRKRKTRSIRKMSRERTLRSIRKMSRDRTFRSIRKMSKKKDKIKTLRKSKH